MMARILSGAITLLLSLTLFGCSSSGLDVGTAANPQNNNGTSGTSAGNSGAATSGTSDTAGTSGTTSGTAANGDSGSTGTTGSSNPNTSGSGTGGSDTTGATTGSGGNGSTGADDTSGGSSGSTGTTGATGGSGSGSNGGTDGGTISGSNSGSDGGTGGTPPDNRSLEQKCSDALPNNPNDIQTYHCTWQHRALRLQQQLDNLLPMKDTFFIASHNSYNSTAYPGVSSSGDPNHSRTMVEQFDMDMQSLELDIHWYPHLASGGNAPVLCHARGASENHIGCGSTDRHLNEGLQEVSDWIRRPENANVVIIIDIENSLQDYVPPNSSSASVAGHDQTIAAFEDKLGDLIYQPPTDGTYHKKPMDLTKQQILAAGKQILLTAQSGETGDEWRKWVYDLRGIRHQKANDGFDAAPDCESSSFSNDNYRQAWVRLWEDTTNLGAATNGSLQPIDGPTLIAMMNCGVNMPSLDQLVPTDTRLIDMVWSWKQDEPIESDGKNCALHDADGRFITADCSEQHRFACYDASNQTWRISVNSGAWSDGATSCTNSDFSTPGTAYFNQLLNAAKTSTGASTLWLNYTDAVDANVWVVNQ